MLIFNFFLFIMMGRLSTGTNRHDDVTSIELTSDIFRLEIERSNYFVMFFAPWCGHCKKLASVWNQLAEKYNNDENGMIKIGRVDCTTDGDLCTDQAVTGYPTLKYFKQGSTEAIASYRGARDLNSFNRFLSEQLNLATQNPDDSNDEVTDLRDSGKAGSPLVELTDDTFAKYISSGKHFVKFYAPWCGHCTKLAPTWEELAKTLHEKDVRLSKIDCTLYRPICSDFEVKGYPTLLWIENGKKIEKYVGSRVHDDLQVYVTKMAGGFGESRGGVETSEKDNTSAVLQLTQSNFQLVIEKGVTFVKFYAPWCGHCLRLAPTWEELATKFSTKPDIKIAKVDCTLGDNRDLCGEQEVNGFPTVYIYRNGEKLSEYNGNRSLEDMHEFVTRLIDSEHDEL